MAMSAKNQPPNIQNEAHPRERPASHRPIAMHLCRQRRPHKITASMLRKRPQPQLHPAFSMPWTYDPTPRSMLNVFAWQRKWSPSIHHSQFGRRRIHVWSHKFVGHFFVCVVCVLLLAYVWEMEGHWLWWTANLHYTTRTQWLRTLCNVDCTIYQDNLDSFWARSSYWWLHCELIFNVLGNNKMSWITCIEIIFKSTILLIFSGRLNEFK